jgi:hypothetical protein
VAIDWPFTDGVQLSGKDAAAPRLADIDTNFKYEPGS